MGVVISDDVVGMLLLQELKQLLEMVSDVKPRRPGRQELDGRQSNQSMLSLYLQRGLQAIGWVSDERGLGGGQNTDGLSWSLSLEDLWERYVESVVRRDAALSGGTVRIGRRGETVVPLPWNDPFHRPLGHLVPDFVVYRGNSVEIVDAKYKSHFADLDANRWAELAEETQSAMRADIHQVLAYAAAAGSGESVKATLVYPVRQSVFEELSLRNQTESLALIPVGSREISLCIKAAVFG
jgi:5-methylcytosine-specific restriction endonuclease McrBC regulatory subunit McrC